MSMLNYTKQLFMYIGEVVSHKTQRKYLSRENEEII